MYTACSQSSSTVPVFWHNLWYSLSLLSLHNLKCEKYRQVEGSSQVSYTSGLWLSVWAVTFERIQGAWHSPHVCVWAPAIECMHMQCHVGELKVTACAYTQRCVCLSAIVCVYFSYYTNFAVQMRYNCGIFHFFVDLWIF